MCGLEHPPMGSMLLHSKRQMICAAMSVPALCRRSLTCSAGDRAAGRYADLFSLRANRHAARVRRAGAAGADSIRSRSE